MTAGMVYRDKTSRGEALVGALGITLLLWLVLGVGCFGFLTQAVADRYGHSLNGSFLLDLGFLVGVLVVIGVVVGWQRARGETLRHLGWRAPTRKIAIVVGIVYGALWVLLSYARGGDPFTMPWQRPVMALIGIVLAFGEELAVRGFLLEQLRRAGVPTWLQVALSSVVMGVYHGVLGAHFSVEYAISSAVLFGLVSVIFVVGRRSLTPGLVAHAMTHVFGDPTLMQGILRGAVAAA